MKNKKNNPDRVEMQKYCKFCHKHTLHKETKQCFVPNINWGCEKDG